MWDPHLVRTDGTWLVGFASARKFFTFHPALATGPTLDDLTLRRRPRTAEPPRAPRSLRLEDGHVAGARQRRS